MGVPAPMEIMMVGDLGRYGPRAARPFFIRVVHRPPGVVGHMTAPELPSQEGRTLSRGARDSTEAPISERQSPEPCDM
jgi:hypothetical protein